MGYPAEVVFVFGSNLAGRHGKGAAKHALDHWGAIYGQGEGPQGNAYAIPTKDEHLRTLPLLNIRLAFSRFTQYAKGRRELFLLTPIGTGLAGYPRGVIRVMVMEVGLPKNVALTGTWVC